MRWARRPGWGQQAAGAPAGSMRLMHVRWNDGIDASLGEVKGFGRSVGGFPSGFDGIVMESADFRLGRPEFEKKKPPNFGGLGERETGLEPATFSLGS